MVDLGAWAAEKHKIPGEPLTGEEDAEIDGEHESSPSSD
jgi:endogenous inhibitor of DNA gyrase (YacG/DUF329 family)